jgi:L-lactate dehydrogenase complex protein LldG
MSAARDAILQEIAKGRSASRPVPDYALPAWTADPASHFMEKARASVASVHEVSATDELPAKIWSLMSAANLPLRLHLPAVSPLNALPWDRAPGLALSAEPPSGVDSALSAADYGIAETGTLVFFSGPKSASSWHFRPGREFMLIRRVCILPRFEDVIGLLALEPRMPATLNLVTGPSRTADIEQTIELGAHGPREVHILIAG